MIWMQLDNDADRDPKVARLIGKFGHIGWSIYTRTLMRISAGIEGDDMSTWGTLSPEDYPLEYLSVCLDCPEDELRKIYDYMASLKLIDPSAWNQGIIRNTKILKRLDNYTKKKQRQLQKQLPPPTETELAIRATYGTMPTYPRGEKQ